jgi:hypothetical protein
MKLFIEQFSPVSRYLLPLTLGPNIVLSTLFSNTLNICCFLSVKASRSHKTGYIKMLFYTVL